MPSHVVVTGAGGFVGGFLAGWLAGRGHTVTAISRRAMQPADENESSRLAWRRADLREPNALPSQFDALIHCAAEIPARLPDPERLYQFNLEGAGNAFREAVAAGVRSIVFLSSMSVYGTVADPVVTEDTPPRDPDPYGRAKLDCERLLEACVKEGLSSGLAIRLPGTVGKGSHHNFLSDVMTRVLSDQPVHANNPDALFNNIVYVGDLAAFLGDWIDRPRAKRPFLIDLDRASSLGYRPSTVKASIKAFVRDSMAEQGHDDGA
jgi:UDP-glucose 4-epimerase